MATLASAGSLLSESDGHTRGFRRIVILLITLVTVPTAALLAVGILMLVLYRASLDIVFGILVVSIVVCLITGSVLALVYLRREAHLSQLQSDFVSKVSHELRTPLTSIAGYTEMLRDHDPGPLNREQERMLATVDRNTGRLRHLIEDILTLSNIESRSFRTAMEPVNVADVVSGSVEALRPEAAGKGLTLTVTAPPSLLVSGDPGQLDRMTINLLSNAVKFTPAGGRVEAGVTREDGLAVITVSDTGIGIPERDQKELFTRFFRASNATERSIPGTGLGLAIVHTIVANHGGDLRLRSREGEGTTVTARIPLLNGRDAATGPGPASRAEPPASSRPPARAAHSR